MNLNQVPEAQRSIMQLQSVSNLQTGMPCQLSVAISNIVWGLHLHMAHKRALLLSTDAMSHAPASWSVPS